MTAPLSPAAFETLASPLKTKSGLIIGMDKLYLLETRLTGIVKREKLNDLNGLAERLRRPGSDVVARDGRVYEFRVRDRRTLRNGEGIRWPDLPDGTPILALECLHFSDGTPIQHERRLVNLDVVPEVVDESFDVVAPSRWLVDRVPWSSADHTVRAVNATAEMAALLGVEAGAACLSIRRQTMHLSRPVTLVHFLSVGDRFSLSGSSITDSATELNL